MNFFTMAFSTAQASGEPIRCSTRSNTCCFTISVLDRGPAKPIENVSNSSETDIVAAFSYKGMGGAF